MQGTFNFTAFYRDMADEGGFFILAQQAPVGYCLLIQEVTGSHTTTNRGR